MNKLSLNFILNEFRTLLTINKSARINRVLTMDFKGIILFCFFNVELIKLFRIFVLHP